MNLFGLSLDFPPVSFVTFVATIIIGMLGIIALGSYISMVKLFGKEYDPYFNARLSFGKKSIIQVYEIDNNMHLEYAERKQGGVFISQLEPGITEMVSPKSVYSVEGVNTMLGYNVFPPLNPQLKTDMKALIDQGITSNAQLEKELNSGKYDAKTNLLFKDFIRRYEEVKKKYSIRVTVDDVLKFLEKNTSLTSIDSISQKIVNKAAHKKIDSELLKKAVMLAFIWVIGLVFILVYTVVYKT